MAAARSGTRRRASHSLETVVSEAVALLDEAGEPALTFRALAQRLGGGVGSIYWYVSGKDELLDRASDHVLASVLTATDRYAAGPGTSTLDAIASLRGIGVALFDELVSRPWLAAYFMRNTDVQPNALRLFERMGQQVMRLELSPKQTFDAVSALLGYVVGVAADLGQTPPPDVADGSVTREELLARFADRWRGLDPDAFPFLHHVAAEMAVHDDAEQFRAGLDLLLAGLRLQAGR